MRRKVELDQTGLIEWTIKIYYPVKILFWTYWELIETKRFSGRSAEDYAKCEYEFLKRKYS